MRYFIKDQFMNQSSPQAERQHFRVQIIFGIRTIPITVDPPEILCARFTVKSPESHVARSHAARNQSHVARNSWSCRPKLMVLPEISKKCEWVK